MFEGVGLGGGAGSAHNERGGVVDVQDSLIFVGVGLGGGGGAGWAHSDGSFVEVVGVRVSPMEEGVGLGGGAGSAHRLLAGLRASSVVEGVRLVAFFFLDFGLLNFAAKSSSVSVGVKVGASAVKVGCLSGWLGCGPGPIHTASNPVPNHLPVVAAGGCSQPELTFLIASLFPNLVINNCFHVALSLAIATNSSKLWPVGASMSKFPPPPSSCCTLTAIFIRRSSSSPFSFFH